jgi:hypothetical protein
MNELPVSPRVKAVKEYYRRLDAGEFPADLFAKDFQSASRSMVWVMAQLPSPSWPVA